MPLRKNEHCQSLKRDVQALAIIYKYTLENDPSASSYEQFQ